MLSRKSQRTDSSVSEPSEPSEPSSSSTAWSEPEVSESQAAVRPSGTHRGHCSRFASACKRCWDRLSVDAPFRRYSEDSSGRRPLTCRLPACGHYVASRCLTQCRLLACIGGTRTRPPRGCCLHPKARLMAREHRARSRRSRSCWLHARCESSRPGDLGSTGGGCKTLGLVGGANFRGERFFDRFGRDRDAAFSCNYSPGAVTTPQESKLGDY